MKGIAAGIESKASMKTSNLMQFCEKCFLPTTCHMVQKIQSSGTWP